jgi:mono/diheme cytochrome c family protein
MLTGLQRVDRCTTCHLGVEDPTMKNAPEPFRYHANLGPHIPSRFGCTICHGGQGLATDKDGAHGKVEFWPNPLLSKDYIRASCGRCHKEGDVPGVPELTEGRRLFETQGCRGCHKLNGVGGSIGPDLTAEGANHRAPEWLERHFLAPNAVSPGSAMPNFHFTKEQARDLTYYMLSLTSEEMGTYYSSVRLIPSPEYGRQLFVEKNCITCHSVGGVGARRGLTCWA